MVEVIEVASSPLKLRRDAIFMKTEKGILFRSRKGVFSFQGKTVYKTFQQLVPHLNGTNSANALLRSAREEVRKPIGDLLGKLVDCEVLQQVDQHDAALIESPVAAAFAPQIDFIAHTTDRPCERFLHFRESRMLLMGDGLALASAGAALLRNGLRTLHVRTSPRTDVRMLAEERARQLAAGLPCDVEADATNERLSWDFMLYCSDRPDLRELHRLNSEAVASGRTLLPAVIIAGKLMVGPTVTPRYSACLQCAWLRWSDNIAGERSSVLWQQIATCSNASLPLVTLSELSAMMLGNTAAMESFRFLVGSLDAESARALLVQDLLTYEAAIKPLLPHPTCTACKGHPAQAVSAEKSAAPVADQSESCSVEECVRVWGRYVDQELGYFTRYDDDDVEQLPLRISLISYGLEGSEGLTRSHYAAAGWDVEDFAQARFKSLQKAVEHKGLLASAHTLGLLLKTDSQPWENAISMQHIFGWLGTSAAHADCGPYLQASSLGDPQSFLVPAAAVHPGFSKGLFDRLSAGVGAGLDIAEATERAVLSLMKAVAFRGVAEGSLAVSEWNAKTLGNDPRSLYVYAAYERLVALERLDKRSLRILIARPCPGIFTAMVAETIQRQEALDEISCGTGFSVKSAIHEALCEMLARQQLLGAGKNLPVAPGGRSLFHASQIFNRCGKWADEDSGESTLANVVQALAHERKTLLRLEITPPDVRLTSTFQVVKVLLIDESVPVFS